MKELILTGSSGFVGTHLLNSLNSKYLVKGVSLRNNNKLLLKDEYGLIHLAGIAHDTKKSLNNELYYKVNYKLTTEIYDQFLNSNLQKFIYFSSIKAVCDSFNELITEETIPNPQTVYGISKRMAEEYILSKMDSYPTKKIYILRPVMIHGEGNKGNLSLLFSILKKGIPWPLGSFQNQRSILSIDNLNTIIHQIIENDIQNGIYHLADDHTISTSEIVQLISETKKINTRILRVPKIIISLLSKIGDRFQFLPLNSEVLEKLTENYIVTNSKIKKQLPSLSLLNCREGLIKTIQYFQ
jgi:nucleoside-diphosphate-sugar epimerase